MPLSLCAYSEKLCEESRALREAAKIIVAESKEGVAVARSRRRAAKRRVAENISRIAAHSR